METFGRLCQVVGLVVVIGLIGLGAVEVFDRAQISLVAKPLLTQAINSDRAE